MCENMEDPPVFHDVYHAVIEVLFKPLRLPAQERIESDQSEDAPGSGAKTPEQERSQFLLKIRFAFCLTSDMSAGGCCDAGHFWSPFLLV
jgi:hypothetical protein